MTTLPASLRLALHPGDAPWAVWPAVRAMLAAGVVAIVGTMSGDLTAVSVAYLGAACAVAFVPPGVFRFQAGALAAQGAGACIGICAGALSPHSAAGFVAVAAAAGVVSGAVGTIGPSAPGFGMMLSIGVAFGQFSGFTLPWWELAMWYVVGTSSVTAATLAPWLFRRGVRERDAAAAVLECAADLCATVGSPAAPDARNRLAAASDRARGATRHPQAELVAFAAASLYAEGHPVPAAAVAAIRAAAAQVTSGEPVDVPLPPAGSPGLVALADALSPEPTRPAALGRPRHSIARTVFTTSALFNGARLGSCLGIATALVLSIREPAHAFWLPLTVAVIVRPEYASVFVRTVNRIGGTVVGALIAAAALVVVPSGLPTAAAAAVALGFAVASAPKLYGLNVIGVTASALLSASIMRGDEVLPAVRVMDTLLGAAVAIVFGYLLWPGARRFPSAARLDAALAAVRAYLAEAVKPAADRRRWQTIRDDAYRLAHQSTAACLRAIAEPPPVSSTASELLPSARALEDVVDAITAVAAAVDAGRPPTGAPEIEAALTTLDDAAARVR